MQIEFKFSCEHCGQHIIAEEAWKNLRTHCPNCGGELQIPEFPVTQTENGQLLVDLSAFSLKKFTLAGTQPDTQLKIPAILQQSVTAQTAAEPPPPDEHPDFDRLPRIVPRRDDN